MKVQLVKRQNYMWNFSSKPRLKLCSGVFSLYDSANKLIQ